MKVFLILIVVFGCTTTKTRMSNSICGTWILSNKKAINYPEISFNKDSTAVFKSKGDTIYRFTYTLIDYEIVLTDLNGNKKSCEIIELTNNKLVFNGLLKNKGRQVYEKK